MIASYDHWKKAIKRVNEQDNLITSSMSASKEHFENCHHLICKIMYNDKHIKLPLYGTARTEAKD
jgi:hypothetical protein